MNFKATVFLCLFVLFTGCKGDTTDRPDEKTPEPRLAEKSAFQVRSPALNEAIATARSALMFRNTEEARQPIDTLLSQFPYDIEGHALAAYADWLDGKYKKAKSRASQIVALLDPYIKKNAASSTVREILARALTILSRVNRAENQLRISIRQGSKDPIVVDQWLSLLIQRENLAEHRELFDKVLSDNNAKENPILCAARGLGLIYLDEMKSAHEILESCIKKITEAEPAGNAQINQTLARLLVTKGIVALRSGELLKARDYFEEAISSSHKDADAHHALAVTMWRLRDVRARESLERALEIRIDPESAFLLGQVHTFNKRLDSAIAQVKLALDHLDLWTQPRASRWQVPFLLGRLLARKGQFAQAQQSLEQALKLDPDPKSHREIYRHLVWVRQKSSGSSGR